MLRVLIVLAIALPLYELLRWQLLRRARAALLRNARTYASRHGVRVDLFKFGGKQLVREELLNDRALLRAMAAAAEAGERPTDVRERVEQYIDEIVPAFSLTAYFELGMRLARAAIGAVYRPVIVTPPPRLSRPALSQRAAPLPAADHPARSDAGHLPGGRTDAGRSAALAQGGSA